MQVSTTRITTSTIATSSAFINSDDGHEDGFDKARTSSRTQKKSSAFSSLMMSREHLS